MSVTITIPDEVAAVLGSDQEEREQRARESIALELYREGQITLRMMGRLAGVGDDFWSADSFRASHGLPAITSENPWDADQDAVERLLRS
jgi:hypothetical protein